MWKQNVCDLLSGDDDLNPACGKVESFESRTLVMIYRFLVRTTKRQVQTADGGDVLVGSMHQLICKICLTESMTNELSTLCPVLK